MAEKEVIFGGPEVRERMLKESLEGAALTRVNYLESQLGVLVRELRYIEGISTGQVNRVAKQALAQLRDNAEISSARSASDGLPGGVGIRAE